MNRHRILVVAAATLSAALWGPLACGDGGTEPPPPDPPRPTTVTVTPATAELTALGATVQLQAQVLDQYGQVMAGAAVSWSSSAASVAAVDGSGLVTAAANGAATITATAGSASGSASGTAAVTVAQQVSTVEVSPAADTVVERDTVRFGAEARDANGHAVAGAEFTWASGDTSVAVVDASGLVTGRSAGEVAVTATSSGVTGRGALVVEEPVPTTVSVAPDSLAFTALGDTVRLMAEVRDQIDRVMEGEPVAWTSAEMMVAAVDSTGLVTAVANGAATITAMAGSASGEAVVTVMQSAGSVIVSPAAATIALGDTVRLAAEVFDENGHLVAGAEFSWASSDVSVATVDASGLVRGAGEGTATITATAGDARGTSEITVENPDRAALVALYEATDGPNWVNSDNWLTDAPLGDWYGVDTNGPGRVIRLALTGRWDSEAQVDIPHGLTGPIPPELGSLANLTGLYLGGNALSGPIPPELGSLANLTGLYLGGNALSGPIPPELGSLANLTGLDLGGNQLSGPIPPELGNLANLTGLYLGGNELTGPIPPELGSLANLTGLDLRGNQLSGPIPPELGNLANLTGLYLGGNALSGPIPPELGNLANLTSLSLSRNALSGPIPPSLLRLDELRYFYIGGNALCVPGTSAFDAWLQAIETHDAVGSSFCNAVDVAVLKSLYDATGGPGWTESGGWPGEGFVEDWYGVSVDSLGRVTELDLARNGLEGRLPARLGELTRMTALRIGDNALRDRLPLSLARLALRIFHYADTELCAPAEESFQAWLDGIASHEGTGVECAPLSDRDVLEILYEATSGPNWTNSNNWLTDAPLRDWYGVGVDGEGRVRALGLSRNALSGPIPPELGSLANLTSLGLDNNALSGPIPPELGNLANLTWLYLGGNQLSGPIPPELGSLANLTGLFLGRNQLTDPIPPELGNLANLTELNLTRNSVTGIIPLELGKLGSLTLLALGGNALEGEIPAELGNLASLEELFLWGNSLTGEIPAELGNLVNVTYLSLSGNHLTGPIPARLGNLAKVTEFHLQGNALSGAIPGQLGRLSSVERMLLWGNKLTGPIPPELGNLSNAKILSFSDNKLSGRIPSELGNLRSVTYLALDGNALSGSLPRELGNLTTVEVLHLDYNNLEGPVPPGFGGMASLQELSLTRNAGMEGPLPTDLTDLHQLDALLAGGTDLCAPSDAGFQAWLEGVYKRRIAPCVAGDPPMAYLTQAVQSREFPVPLVAEERALLRVFPTARKATSVGIPLVRARFYLNGRETHVEDIPGKSTPIPTAVDESSLSKSANAEIPAEVIEPGLEMVIEVDPEGTLDEDLGVAKRIPETGRLAVEVRDMPVFDLTVIPFVWTQTNDESIVDLAEAMAADPENHEMLGDTRTLLPIGDLEVTAHEPVVSSSNSAFVLLAQTVAIRAMEGGTGHYKGMMSPPVTEAGGVARLPGRSSFSQPYADILAHELGHNLYLFHAPCGGAGGPDPSFPYSDGSIGAWGYDFRDGGRLVRPSAPDLMSYCGPKWISDYHFTNALRFRLSDADSVGLPDRGTPTQSLLLWGGAGVDSVPFLEPAFVLDARPELPRSGGEYQLTGRTGGGGELFSLSFAMPQTADGDGSSSFAFVLPVQSGWANALATITLSGPGGSFTLDTDSDLSVTILRNPRNGQVRGILRDLPDPATAAAFAAGPGLEVLFSRGIPGAAAWRR